MKKAVELKFSPLSLEEIGARLGISRTRQKEILAVIEQPGISLSSQNGKGQKGKTAVKQAMPKKHR